MRARAGGETRRRFAEAALAGAGLAALAAAVLGGYVAEAGFYNDDWVYFAGSLHPAETNLIGHLREFEWLSFRPLMIPYWPALYGALGGRPELHAAWLLLTCVLQAGLVYGLLRRFDHHPVDAALIAGLVLLLPIASSTRVWPAMSANVLAVVLWLTGLHAGLSALNRQSRLLHAVALVLSLASVLLYEIAAAAVVFSGALYVVHAGRRGLRPWLVTSLAVAVVLVAVTSGTFYEPLAPVEAARHAVTIARESVTAAARVLWPLEAWSTAASRAACVALAAPLVAVALRLRGGRLGDGARARSARLWLATAAAGLVVAVAGYAMIVPSDMLHPLGAGQNDRANLVAGMGLAVIVYSALAAAGVLVTATPRRRLALTAALASFVLAGSAVELHRRGGDWKRAAQLQERSLQAVERAAGRPPAGTTVLTVSAPTEAAPGVPVFAAVWDFKEALRLRLGDRSLRGYPVPAGTRVECSAGKLRLRNYNDAFEPQTAPYGRTLVVDVAAVRAEPVDGAADCRRLAARTG